jgi:hypothetical protein
VLDRIDVVAGEVGIGKVMAGRYAVFSAFLQVVYVVVAARHKLSIASLLIVTR